MTKDTEVQDRSETADAPAPRLARAFNEEETRYMTGDREPVTSSVLISNSKYLNSPLYRDAFSQFALRRQGHDVPTTYLVPLMVKAITDVTDFKDYIALVAEERQKNAEFAAWLDGRRTYKYELAGLGGYKPGTLGAAVRTFLEGSGMNIDFAMKGEVTSDFDYLKQCQSMSHDLEHMVTGFGPNQFGEVALGICNNTVNANYFSPKLAAYISSSSMFLSTTSYPRVSLHYPQAMPGYFEAMRQGITAGQKLRKPLFMVRWEDYLDWSLADIAAELGIERGPGEAWAYSTELTMG